MSAARDIKKESELEGALDTLKKNIPYFFVFYEEFKTRLEYPYKEYKFVGKPIKLLNANAGRQTACKKYIEEKYKQFAYSYSVIRTKGKTKEEIKRCCLDLSALLNALKGWMLDTKQTVTLTAEEVLCKTKFPRVTTLMTREFNKITNLKAKMGLIKDFDELYQVIDVPNNKLNKILNQRLEEEQVREIIEYFKAIVSLEEYNKYILPAVPTHLPGHEGGGSRRTRRRRHRRHSRRA